MSPICRILQRHIKSNKPNDHMDQVCLSDVGAKLCRAIAPQELSVDVKFIT